MPPSTRRQGGRKIKQEPDVEADAEPELDTTSTAQVPQIESPVLIGKSDNDDAQSGDLSQSLAQSAPQTIAKTSSGLGTAQQPQNVPSGYSSPARTAQSSTPQPAALRGGGQPARRFQTRAGIVRKSEAERKRAEQDEFERRRRRDAQGGVADGHAPQQNTRGQRGARRGRTGPIAGSSSGARGPDRAAGSVTEGWAFGRAPTTGGRVTHAQEQVLATFAKTEQPSVDRPPSTDKKDATTANGKGKSKTPVKTTKTADDGNIVMEDEDLDRTDIEHINLISDEEDDVDDDDVVSGHGRRRLTSRSALESGLRPIRLEKHEHVKRAVGVAASKAKSNVNIKLEEPGEEYSVLHNKSVLKDDKAVDTVQPGATNATSFRKDIESKAPSPSLDRKIKPERRRRPSSRDLRLAHETVEEQQERLRYEKDLRNMAREFGSSLEEAVDLDDGPESLLGRSLKSGKDGQLYLFQLPPMTPMLVPQNAEGVSQQQHELFKADSEPAKAANADKTKVTKIKKEPGTDGDQHGLRAAAKVLSAGDGRLPSGLVGKLNVHQSGKVTLDWGGTSMAVNWGSEVDFLQDAVLAVPRDETSEPVAYSLAQVRKKLVVTPDWEKIYE